MLEMDQILLKKNGKTICWRKLSMDDVKEVDKLMIEFCRSEPMCALLNCPKLNGLAHKKSKAALAKNLSIGAYDSDNKEHLCSICVVGVCGPADIAGNIQVMSNQFSHEHTIVPRIILEALVGIEEITHGENFLEHCYAVTLPSYQKMGITTELQRKIETAAIQQSYRFIVGVYTSEFTKIVSKKLGYKCYKEITYADYTDPLTKNQPFKDIQFHVSVKAMYLELKMQ